ncbi:MAG: hypothetical protein KF832_13740, partial [Caldilineaceae bacterium]|nr:hypothetical protein [Caldilineaceae bacterium]
RLKVTIDCDRNVIIDTERPAEESTATVIDCDGCPVKGRYAKSCGYARFCVSTWVRPEDGVIASGDLPTAAWLEYVEIAYDKCQARYESRRFDLRRFGVIFDTGV